MGEIGKLMPKVFALFTAGVMASLALPGMRGFASELSVFIGFATSEIYSSPFRIGTVILASVGLILTPIYLLSMLRQLFYNTGVFPACVIDAYKERGMGEQEAVCFGTNCALPAEVIFSDAKPRELAIAFVFLLPVLGIGFYPKLATQFYDVKTVAINTQIKDSYTQIAQTRGHIYAKGFWAPTIAESDVTPNLAVIK
jgi:NAD(P)H-quinone oxidoreductase subunit 4